MGLRQEITFDTLWCWTHQNRGLWTPIRNLNEKKNLPLGCFFVHSNQWKGHALPFNLWALARKVVQRLPDVRYAHLWLQHFPRSSLYCNWLLRRDSGKRRQSHSFHWHKSPRFCTGSCCSSNNQLCTKGQEIKITWIVTVIQFRASYQVFGEILPFKSQLWKASRLHLNLGLRLTPFLGMGCLQPFFVCR